MPQTPSAPTITTKGIREITLREYDVLSLMAKGLNNNAISQELVLSNKSICNYIGSIYSKLGLTDATNGSKRVIAVLIYLKAFKP